MKTKTKLACIALALGLAVAALATVGPSQRITIRLKWDWTGDESLLHGYRIHADFDGDGNFSDTFMQTNRNSSGHVLKSAAYADLPGKEYNLYVTAVNQFGLDSETSNTNRIIVPYIFGPTNLQHEVIMPVAETVKLETKETK